MSTLQHIQEYAAALPEELQREALDFIEFLAAKYRAASHLTALDIKRLPNEQRNSILAEQAEQALRHYRENPVEILPDISDEIIEETP